MKLLKLSSLLAALAFASCTIYPNGMIGPGPALAWQAPIYVQPGPVVVPAPVPYAPAPYVYAAPGVVLDYSILPYWGFIGWYGGVYYNNAYWYAHPYGSWRGRGWSGWHEHGGGYGYHGGGYGHYNGGGYHGSVGGYHGGSMEGFHGSVGGGHMSGGHVGGGHGKR